MLDVIQQVEFIAKKKHGCPWTMKLKTFACSVLVCYVCRYECVCVGCGGGVRVTIHAHLLQFFFFPTTQFAFRKELDNFHMVDLCMRKNEIQYQLHCALLQQFPFPLKIDTSII